MPPPRTATVGLRRGVRRLAAAGGTQPTRAPAPTAAPAPSSPRRGGGGAAPGGGAGPTPPRGGGGGDERASGRGGGNCGTLPAVNGAESQRYWDAKARENALYYVDNKLDYESPDTDDFWRHGDDV